MLESEHRMFAFFVVTMPQADRDGPSEGTVPARFFFSQGSA